MYVLESPEYLVEEELDVVGGEALVGSDDRLQVCLHQVTHHVYVVEVVSSGVWG